MARTPKPRELAADGVLEDAAPPAPVAQAAEATAALASSEAAPAAQGFVLIVRALQPVRRRAGRVFTPEPVAIDTADLTPAEIEALQGDPLLHVAVTDADSV